MISFKIHLKDDIILSGKKLNFPFAIETIGKYIKDREFATEDIKSITIVNEKIGAKK